MISEKKLLDYANVIAKIGVNVQKGQVVMIYAIVDAALLVKYVTEACYKLGAKQVIVRYDDIRVTSLGLKYCDLTTLTTIPKYAIDSRIDPIVNQHGCVIHIRGSDPNGLKGADPKKMIEIARVNQKVFGKLSNWTMSGKSQWTIACWPTIEWAKIVFPKKQPEDAVNALWDAILKTVRVDGKNDPIKLWNAHNNETDKRANAMNKYNFDYLHFANKLGTDLKVKLVKNHIWLSGREKGLGNKWKASFTANLPTEETWTMPDRNGMNGKVYATKPLSYNGNLIDNFWFEFKNGKVINHGAKVGKQVLDAILKIDEGSSRTGEISLVPNSSPINQSGIIFYSTLYDENATCHIALGASYPNNIVGGITKTREQLKKLGGNDSAVHIDFMFGSDDLNIYGYKGKNKPICICKNGKLLV